MKWPVLLALVLAACGSSSKSSPNERDGGSEPAADAATGDAGPSDAGGGEPAFTVRDGFLRDREGRAILLRGVNIAHTAKRSVDGVPWVDQEAVARLREELGFNVIRLTLFWRWVEPERGQYDEAYLAKIEALLDWAAAADVHVMLDMHQDLFGFEATDLNEGDGPPAWARDASCPPFENKTPWIANYFTDAIACQFSSFWGNKDGIQDTFVAMWRHVAARLGKHEAVVGVDLFNEPFIPPAFGSPADALTPFYDKLVPAVREAAPGLVVFFEPGTLSGSIADQSIPTPAFPGLVYAPHFYPNSVFNLGAGGKYMRGTDLDLIDERQRADISAEVPRFIGEFGLADGIVGADQFYRDLLALWRPAFVGFALWSYDSTRDYPLSMLDETGAVLPHVLALVEPYAERVPGTPRTTALDAEAGRFELTFTSTGGDLVISCPALRCAGSRTLTSGGEPLEARYDEARGQLVATVPAGEVSLVLAYTGRP